MSKDIVINPDYPDLYKLRQIKWGNYYNFSIKNFIKYDMVSLPHYLETRPRDILNNLKEGNLVKSSQAMKNMFYLRTFINKHK